MASFAICADERTTLEISPSCKWKMGPYFLAREERERCGWCPSWWRLPIMGSFRGPGSDFLPFLLLRFLFDTYFRERKRRIDAISMESRKFSSMNFLGSLIFFKG